MKRVHPMSVVRLQDRIDRAVRIFQRGCGLASPDATGQLAQIYRLLLDAAEPMGRGEIVKRLGLTFKGAQYQVHGRLRHLVAAGWIYEAGRRRSPYYKNSDRTHPVFAALPTPTNWSVLGAKARLDKYLDRLDQRAYQVPSCMASHVVRPLDQRAREMLERRMKGEFLQDIGDDYGLTRERVRQIVAISFVPQRPRRGRAASEGRARRGRPKKWQVPDDPMGWWLM
jgi:hypothetical protein